MIRYFSWWALCISVFLSGCSIFPSDTQKLSISSNVPNATVLVNGEVYVLPVELEMRRDKIINVTCEEPGYELYQTLIDTHISTTGWLDFAGCIVTSVFIVGILFPGAFSLDTTDLYIELKPAIGTFVPRGVSDVKN